MVNRSCCKQPEIRLQIAQKKISNNSRRRKTKKHPPAKRREPQAAPGSSLSQLKNVGLLLFEEFVRAGVDFDSHSFESSRLLNIGALCVCGFDPVKVGVHRLGHFVN